nr:hypothetical protein [Streptomyces spiroverticillatus]
MVISLAFVVTALLIRAVPASIPVRPREVRLPYPGIISVAPFGITIVQAIRFITADGDLEQARRAAFTIALLLPGGSITLIRLLTIEPKQASEPASWQGRGFPVHWICPPRAPRAPRRRARPRQSLGLHVGVCPDQVRFGGPEALRMRSRPLSPAMHARVGAHDLIDR